MRITKDPDLPDPKDIAKITANLGCNVCPRCGETKDFFDYMSEGLNKGLSGTATYRLETVKVGFFRTRLMRIDCYSCYTCGCEWESEPYPA